MHLHCPPWALGLGGIIVSSNSVSKNKKIVKELDLAAVQITVQPQKCFFFFVTSEGVINHSVYQQEGLAGVWGWGRTVFKLASLLEAECGGS